jgi:hypothetical protein
VLYQKVQVVRKVKQNVDIVSNWKQRNLDSMGKSKDSQNAKRNQLTSKDTAPLHGTGVIAFNFLIQHHYMALVS